MGRPRKSDKLYRAKEPFVTQFEGETVSVGPNDLIRGGHPLLKGREDLFVEATDYVRFDVEEATDAPGEKRGEEKPSAKKPSAKK